MEKNLSAHGGCLDIKKAMKDVAACDKPRGSGKQLLIRGFPNGVTSLTEGQRPCFARSNGAYPAN